MAKHILRDTLEILSGEDPYLVGEKLDNTIHIMVEFLSVEGRSINDMVWGEDSMNHFIIVGENAAF